MNYPNENIPFGYRDDGQMDTGNFSYGRKKISDEQIEEIQRRRLEKQRKDHDDFIHSINYLSKFYTERENDE